MGIKRKKPGPTPNAPLYTERWKELAKSKERFPEARYEYRIAHPNTTLADAHREVTAFHREHTRRYG